MPTNEERIAKAARAVQEYLPGTKRSKSNIKEDVEDAVTGLLADLRHFCDNRNIDFDARLQSSLNHFNAEH